MVLISGEVKPVPGSEPKIMNERPAQDLLHPLGLLSQRPKGNFKVLEQECEREFRIAETLSAEYFGKARYFGALDNLNLPIQVGVVLVYSLIQNKSLKYYDVGTT